MSYPVMEYFYSVQGEGFHAGSPAFFIRLGGCDVGCVWCDVKDSWDKDAHPVLETDVLVGAYEQSGAGLVIITGGEPAMYDLHPLTSALKEKGALVHIETSGVYELKGVFDWITFSPKKFKKPHPMVFEKADELKIIVFNASDLEWAEEHAGRVGANCRLYLQPEWSRREKMQSLIFDYVLRHPEWRISLQTHKYLGVD